MTETNILPDGFRKYMFEWCGAGTYVNISLVKAGGILITKKYENISDFTKKAVAINEVMSFLKSIYKELRVLILDKKSQALQSQAEFEESKEPIKPKMTLTDEDLNLCGICFVNNMEMAL